jgi:hypothetical protein
MRTLTSTVTRAWGRTRGQCRTARTARPRGQCRTLPDRTLPDRADCRSIDALADRCLWLARAELAGDRRGCAVGQKDPNADERGEGLARDTYAAQWPGAEPANDRRVREQEKWFGHKRAEHGDREPQNLAVMRTVVN